VTLKVKRAGVFVPVGGGVAIPQPTCIGYDADNFASSGTSLAWGPIPYVDGDLLVMSVMHRSVLTTPAGWTLHSVASITYRTGGTQYTSILSRRMTEAGDASGTLVQASSNRMIIGVLNLRGAGTPIDRSDLTLSTEDKRGVYSFTVPGKGSTSNLVVWALSVPFWTTATDESPPYISGRYIPWESSPLMGRPVWSQPTSRDQPRLGMFLDRDAPAAIKFTSTSGHSNDWVALVAVEIPGITP